MTPVKVIIQVLGRDDSSIVNSVMLIAQLLRDHLQFSYKVDLEALDLTMHVPEVFDPECFGQLHFDLTEHQIVRKFNLDKPLGIPQFMLRPPINPNIRFEDGVSIAIGGPGNCHKTFMLACIRQMLADLKVPSDQVTMVTQPGTIVPSASDLETLVSWHDIEPMGVGMHVEVRGVRGGVSELIDLDTMRTPKQ